MVIVVIFFVFLVIFLKVLLTQIKKISIISIVEGTLLLLESAKEESEAPYISFVPSTKLSHLDQGLDVVDIAK